MAELKPLEFPNFTKPPVEYKIVDDDYSQEVWPMSFKWKPTIGETVESQSGRTLMINDITYKHDGVVLITLGREMGGSTGIEGAGIGPIGVEGDSAVT